jgi:hypothetical protein
MFWIGLGVGLVVGGMCGFMTAALLAVSDDNE